VVASRLVANRQPGNSLGLSLTRFPPRPFRGEPGVAPPRGRARPGASVPRERRETLHTPKSGARFRSAPR
jgi:hypothetical protein